MNSLTFDAVSNLWVDGDGGSYIKCEFDPYNPHYIYISADCWETEYNGTRHWIDWGEFTLPDAMGREARGAVLTALTRRSPGWLSAARLALVRLTSAARPGWRSFADVSMDDWARVWVDATESSAHTLRTIYRLVQEQTGDEQMLPRVFELDAWHCGARRLLRDVLRWDAHCGALTAAELELVRRRIQTRPTSETTLSHGVRVYGWLLLETGKRPLQVARLPPDCLHLVSHAGVDEWFIDVPPAKRQTGRATRRWPISARLATEVALYSARPEVGVLQKRFGRLIALDTPTTRVGRQMSTNKIGGMFRSWFAREQLVSPRTGKLLHLAQYRLRHTVATRMAAHGASRGEIQHVLEHDSPFSSSAYIAAVGSELAPAMERADRQLGGLFAQLADAFFAGTIAAAVGNQPIFLPMVEPMPMMVGSCGLDTRVEGTCAKHPFFACYNGCGHFLAWRDAPHERALAFVEAEMRRWSDAEGHGQRSRLVENLERVHRAISDVIEQIARENR